MIFGSCPHCDAYVSTPMAQVNLPVWSKEVCPNCNKEYWLKHSRIDCYAQTNRPEGLKSSLEKEK